MEQSGPRSAHGSAGSWAPDTLASAFRVPEQAGAADVRRPRGVPAGATGDGPGTDPGIDPGTGIDAGAGAGRGGGSSAGPGGGSAEAPAAARGEHTHSEVPIPRPRAEGTRPAARVDDARTPVRPGSPDPAVRPGNNRPAHTDETRPGGRSESARPVRVDGIGLAAHAENVRPVRGDDARPVVRAETARPVVQRASVRGQILDALRTALVAGELAPGEVYSAPALGERFGVSATPVREAMQQLALEGAVEVVPNRGFRVVERGTRELAELAEIRGLIEVPVMLRLARTVPAARWAELRPLAEATVRAASSGCRATYAECDRSFHRAVLALAGNAQLVRIADDLHRRAQWPLVGGPVSRGRADLVADAAEHTALLDALIAEDLTVVQALVREHFTGAP